MPPLPKFSFVLLAHNREKYIRSALENAFAQDYEGEIEYIISDDCSTDSTFDVIRDVVAGYRGDRRVIVTQTPRNMHLAGNTNHALQFATGDWIIRADDDDYSTHDRCSVIAAAIAAHPDAAAVATGIGSFRTEEEEQIRRRCALPSGNATDRIVTDIFRGDSGPAIFGRGLLHQAWSKKVYTVFGELPLEGYYIDDLTCFYRSLMLGPHISVPGACTLYARNDGSNMSRGASGSTRHYKNIVTYERFLVKYNAMTAPLIAAQIEQYRRYMHDNLPPETHPFVERYLADLQLQVDRRVADAARWEQSTWQRLRRFFRNDPKNAFTLLRCLPLPLYAALEATFRRLAGQ